MSHRKLGSRQPVIASHNAGKVREMLCALLFEPFGIEPVSAGISACPELRRRGTTFWVKMRCSRHMRVRRLRVFLGACR